MEKQQLILTLVTQDHPFTETPLRQGTIELADMTEAALVAEASSELHGF